MNYLNGPVLAMILPETDSRILPVEIASYWIQHGLMFIIPMYLLWIGGKSVDPFCSSPPIILLDNLSLFLS